MNITAIREELDATHRAMKRFKQMKSRVTRSQNILDNVKDDIDDLRDEIGDEYDGISTDLVAAGG